MWVLFLHKSEFVFKSVSKHLDYIDFKPLKTNEVTLCSNRILYNELN